MIKVVCFDLDGVFFTKTGFAGFKESLISLGAAKEAVEFYFHKEPMEEFKRGEIEESDFWEEAVKYLGLNVSPDVLINLLPQKYEINDEVLEYIQKLKQKGIKTCICSNNFITRVQKLEKRFHFLQNFDCAVFSYQVGVLKPNKEIFESLLKELNIQPSELIYSDDTEDKLSAAKELGIQTHLYVDFAEFKKFVDSNLSLT